MGAGDGHLPNFLIIGAKKAATTSLHLYLGQHPDVFVSALKESRFFAFEPNNPGHLAGGRQAFPIRTLDEYRRLFRVDGMVSAIGESSPDYLQSPVAPGRIAKTLPEVRLIVSLRDPVSRAYSSYLMNVRSGRECRSLGEAFQPDEWWVRGGLYYEDLKRYLKHFARDRMCVVVFDDVKVDPLGTTRKLFSFVGVDPDFEPNVSEQHNAGGVPKSMVLQHASRLLKGHRRLRRTIRRIVPGALARGLRTIEQRNLAKAPDLDPELAERMRSFYRDDILRTQDLIGLDLTGWLRGR